jgi:cobalt-zinc-cadmium efflux system membrane fusion protein
MLDSSIKSSGLELLKVEPMMFENALELKGELKFPDNFESLVAPKASGTLIKTYRNIGDKVSQGDLLAVVQSQDLIRLNADRKVALDTLQFARQKWNKNEHYGKSVYHLRLIIFLQREILMLLKLVQMS